MKSRTTRLQWFISYVVGIMIHAGRVELTNTGLLYYVYFSPKWRDVFQEASQVN